MGFIYKGYLLRSKSIQVADSDRWTSEVTISRHKAAEGDIGEKTFSCDSSFSSKDLADMECIIFGRKIIDGEITGLSIE